MELSIIDLGDEKAVKHDVNTKQHLPMVISRALNTVYNISKQDGEACDVVCYVKLTPCTITLGVCPWCSCDAGDENPGYYNIVLSLDNYKTFNFNDVIDALNKVKETFHFIDYQ